MEGAGAELMVPKWFDKSPALTHEQNLEQLRESLRNAADGVDPSSGAGTSNATVLSASAQEQGMSAVASLQDNAARVLLQAVAILVLVGAVWWRHNAGG